MKPLLRSIARYPGFTALMFFILAIGISADTIIFTFVCAIMLGQLPCCDRSRLIMRLKLIAGGGWASELLGRVKNFFRSDIPRVLKHCLLLAL